MSMTSTMTSLISAGAGLRQAQLQNSALTYAKGRAGVLEAEIKNSVGDTAAKQEELDKTNEHIDELASKPAETLGKANKELENTDRAEFADTVYEKAEEEKTGETAQTDEDKEKPAGALYIEALDSEKPDPFRLPENIDFYV